MQTFDTLSEAITALKQQGYTLDFNLYFDQIKCESENICLNPNQFEIVQTFRFEGMTNPSDSSILYAIESLDGKLRGVLVSAYGVYSEETDPVMLQKLRFHHE